MSYFLFSFTDYLNDTIASLIVFKKAPSLATFKFELKFFLMISYVGRGWGLVGLLFQ